MQLIASAIIRDFLVVEDRESLFSTKAQRSRALPRKEQTIIYLPRFRYSKLRTDRPLVANKSVQHRAKHNAGPHVRRADSASTTERFLAQRYGLSLAQGFTFVRPHEREIGVLKERLKVYRSNSVAHDL